MLSEFDLLMRADSLFSKLKRANIRLYGDKWGNIVAKGYKDQQCINTVVFWNQFEGSDGNKLLSQAEMLCKEFGL